MAKLVMENKKDESVYLHLDFHEAVDNAISYIGENYGDAGVKEYLTDYAHSYFTPMSLSQIKDYFVTLYSAEQASDVLTTQLSGQRLTIKISACPAITYFRSYGRAPSKWFSETTKTLYKELANLSGLGFELKFYDEDTGAAEFSFFKDSSGFQPVPAGLTREAVL